MIEEDCLFCDVFRTRKDEIAAQTFSFYIKWDQFPVTPGHLEIVSISHRESLFQLHPEAWQSLGSAVKVAKSLIEETDLEQVYRKYLHKPYPGSERFLEAALESENLNKTPDAYTVGVNEGRMAGRTIDHLHIHVIPRYEGDVENPRGGIRNIIPGKGNY